MTAIPIITLVLKKTIFHIVLLGVGFVSLVQTVQFHIICLHQDFQQPNAYIFCLLILFAYVCILCSIQTALTKQLGDSTLLVTEKVVLPKPAEFQQSLLLLSHQRRQRLLTCCQSVQLPQRRCLTATPCKHKGTFIDLQRT